MLMQRTEFYKHRQLLEMLSSYAAELRPALVQHDWKTRMRVTDNVMLSMEAGPANIFDNGWKLRHTKNGMLCTCGLLSRIEL